MKINVKKISEITGYSPATVSNALSGKRSVSKEAAERILKTAKDYGFYENTPIKKIKFVNFKDSGIVCADNTPFFSAVIEGVVTESQKLGYEITLYTLSKCQADYQDVLDQVLSDTGCAIIILATEMTEKDAKPFQDFPGPLVMLDCQLDSMNFHAVVHSNTDSFMRATEYLLQCGHREIGYLSANIRIQNFQRRQLGYEMILSRYHIPLNPDYTFSLTPTLESSYADMKQYLEQGIRIPTAFVADNDNIALGAVKAFEQYGYRIPEDISIVGFDDIPFCTISSPPLTTIRVYKEELGQMAVRKISELANHPTQARTILQVCDVLVERSSVKVL